MLDLATAEVVRFPLRGEWAALSTPAERVPSHGTDYFGQRYAYDFCRLAPGRDLPYSRGFWRHLLTALPPEDFLGWGEPVLSAFNGSVIETGDGWPDRRRVNLLRETIRGTLFAPRPRGRDWRPLTGNFVLVEGSPGVALYAHLSEGSVRVRPGQRVLAGERLGSVGNSGNSTMPHLHFHLMDRADPPTAQGRLCAFRDYLRRRGNAWEPVVAGVPELMERIRVDWKRSQ